MFYDKYVRITNVIVTNCPETQSIPDDGFVIPHTSKTVIFTLSKISDLKS